MPHKYDVIIVGGGPAAIFAALELSQAADLDILLIEKGRDIDKRQCPARDTGRPCIPCSLCNLVCGLGGAGAFSDGKLTLSPRVGGRLSDYLGESQTEDLIGASLPSLRNRQHHRQQQAVRRIFLQRDAEDDHPPATGDN